MKFLFTISLLLLSNYLFAHRGNFLAITNVVITENKDSYTYDFDIENINLVELANIKVEFVINRKSVYQRYYPTIPATVKFVHDRFIIPKTQLNPEVDKVQIEITELFSTKDDWGGWDSPNITRQVNTLYSEFYVDAPWRMKKTDDQGNINDIPVHFFLHDADLVTGFTLKLDYVNIQIKNASAASFGPVLTYNNIPDADYRAMFSCMSPGDANMSIKQFDINSFSANSSNTMFFDAESDFLDQYVSVNNTYYYFTFNIPASELQGMENIIDIKITVSYANLTVSDDNFGLRVFRSDEDIPSLPNWYKGDTHLHSMYTQSDAEIGLPLCATKKAAQLIGLDWITTTDHTTDFDNYGDGNIYHNWTILQNEASSMNQQDGSMVYIPAQEVSVNNAQDNIVHMLAYGNPSDPLGLPFLGDGGGDVSSTNVSIDNVLDALNAIHGFSYAAHPYATASKLPTVPINGGIWNVALNTFPPNGDNFPETGGNIICNDLSSPSDVLSSQSDQLIKEGLRGSQIWNHRASLSVSGTSGDELDAFDVDNNGTPLAQVDTASTSFHLKKLRQGQEIVNAINVTGLSLKNSNPNFQNWKMFISAGADAHGSFNYSNTGNFAGFGGIDNNAVGKFSTIAYCPQGMGTHGENVLQAMYNGHVSLSDGPILTMGFSDNGDDKTNEILMGDDTTLNAVNIDDYYVNFSYATTIEFGNITNFMIAVGTEDGEIRKTFSLPDTNGTHTISYKLTTLLDSILGVGNYNQDTYYYLRAEIQTYIDYSGQENIYRTNYESYHSLTNNVWFKISDLYTDVTQLALASYPNPFTDEFTLIIKNPGQNDIKVNIYNEIGQLVKSELRYVDNKSEVKYNFKEMGMAKGIYTIRATVDNSSAILKLVKL